MTAPVAGASFAVTDDELQVLGGRLGIAEFPTVLAVRPRHGTVDALERAHDAARGRLTRRGFLGPDGHVSPALADIVHTLQRPSRELALRLVTPDGTARICIAKKAGAGVAARRVHNEIRLSALDGTDFMTATRALVAELPAAEPADFDAFGAPSCELAACLDGGHDARYLTDRLRGIGAAQRTALALGAAFAARPAFGEITCRMLDPVADRIVRTPGAVAVFYTKRGRLVSAPSVSPSGQLWATLKPGTDHRLTQAVAQLTELVPGGWEGGPE